MEVTQDASVPTSNAGADGLLNCTNTSYNLDGSGSSGDNLIYTWYNSLDEEIGTGAVLSISLSDTYTLLVTNQSNGCTSTDEVTVTQDASVPTSNAGADGLLDCTSTSYNLDGSGSSGENLIYTWYNSLDEEIGTGTVLSVSLSGTYTLLVTNQNNGCTSTDQVIVSQDINYPVANAGINGTITCVNDTFQLDGSNSTGDNLTYNWYNAVGDLLSTTVTFTVFDPGNYSLVVTNAVNGCSATDELFVFENTVDPLASATTSGILNCLSDEVTLSVLAPLGWDLAFSWYNDSAQLLGTEMNVTVAAAGNYTLLVTNLSNGCGQTDIVQVIADLAAPHAVANTIIDLSCIEESGLVSGQGSSLGVDFIYQWTGPGMITEPLTIETEVNTEGVYSLQITNLTNGCSATAQTEVLQSSDFPGVPDMTLLGPYCNGDKATLIISNVTGGSPPYLYSVDGGNSFDAGNIFEALAPGGYEVLIQDGEGCQYTENVLVPQAVDLQIDLDPLLSLDYGTTHQLNASVNLEASAIASILWSPGTGLSCTDCLSPIVTASQSMRYYLTIADVNGCKAQASILLKTNKKQHVYIPSAFSPNGDSNNDEFMIYSGENGIAEIKSLRIYDRWGEQVFESLGAQAGDPTYGWDGTIRGKKLNPGVFIYVAEVIWVDGTSNILKGDVTLME